MKTVEAEIICQGCKQGIIPGMTYRADGHNYCPNCYDELFIECSECGDTVFRGEITEINEKFYCKDCLENLFTTCSYCENIIPNDDSIYLDGDDYCQSCFEDLFIQCDSCGEIISNDDVYYSESRDANLCESCYDRNENGNLHEYEYQPIYQYYKLDSEKSLTVKKLYFGIELEMENNNNADIQDIISGFDENYQYAKYDGSLDNGLEIVSHPATYDWLCGNSDKWNDLLDELINSGYLSYQTDTCGMHIHISKDAFTQLHLYRFLKFFEENPGFITRISQRTKDNLNTWAKIENDDGNYTVVYKAKYKNNDNSNRHVAVNLANDDTVEIRIFRGTLYRRSFWKNIQFVKALFDFTANCGFQETTLFEFSKFMKNNAKKYFNIYYFMVEKELLV